MVKNGGVIAVLLRATIVISQPGVSVADAR
jgi:hypothetical protein